MVQKILSDKVMNERTNAYYSYGDAANLLI